LKHGTYGMIDVKPEEVGLCSTRLAQIYRYLHRHYISTNKIAGAQTLVARHGRIVYFSAIGMMDVERHKPMAEDTIFRIYSMTKPITSVAMMTLYEQGKFQLNDAVFKFISEWKDLRVFKSGCYTQFVTEPIKRPMTLLDLMTHTSGLTFDFMETTNVDAAYHMLKIGAINGNESLRKMIVKLA